MQERDIFGSNDALGRREKILMFPAMTREESQGQKGGQHRGWRIKDAAKGHFNDVLKMKLSVGQIRIVWRRNHETFSFKTNTFGLL